MVGETLGGPYSRPPACQVESEPKRKRFPLPLLLDSRGLFGERGSPFIRSAAPTMERVQFDVAVKAILTSDRRYETDGYHFLRDALDHTIKALRKDELIEHRHVTGHELLEGLVALAVERFGPMAVAVLDSWGIREGDDVGTMVFNLIGAGAFGKSDEDSPSDFCGVMNLREELLAPYRPTREVLAKRGASPSELEPPARGNQPAKSSDL
ncbi:MAG: hypothetical protein B9S36_03305 [Verrucomicrobiia bacterium Tous-C2TDCM]|nr:MAG: hypothetical protein B9S36_03305 [Verrucomicrobiae bacterium Tous-C2TDCM]